MTRFFNKKWVKIVGIVLIGLILLWALFSIIPPKKVVDDNPYIDSNVQIIAHRGGRALNPESTLKAFIGAVSDSHADILELDLHLTQDKKLIINHDYTLNRTSNCEEVFGQGDKYIKDYTYQQLRQLNMGYKFTNLAGAKPYQDLVEVPNDLKILLFTDLLDYYSSNTNIKYVIEIKDSAERGEEAMGMLKDVLESYNLFKRASVGSFNQKVQDYIDENCPIVERSASMGEVAGFYISSVLGVDVFANPKFTVLQIPMNYDISFLTINLSTKAFMRRAHEHNIALQYWTINTEEDITRLVNFGADAIISDNPKLVYDTLVKLGKR